MSIDDLCFWKETFEEEKMKYANKDAEFKANEGFYYMGCPACKGYDKLCNMYVKRSKKY